MVRFLHISVVLMLLFLLDACTGKTGNTCPKEDRDSYTVEYVKIPALHSSDSYPHPYISAYLLLPAELPASGHPAVLLFHDHGAKFTIGKEKLVRPLRNPDLSDSCNIILQEEAQQWVDKFYGSMFIADSLAAHGYAVLVPDALGWGERMFIADYLPNPLQRLQGDTLKKLNKHIRADQQYFYERHLSETGEPWFESILSDDNSAFRWLAKHPDIDAKRIGVAGFSMGAYRAWNLAAENRSISWCVAANWMTTLKANGGPTPNESAWSMYRPLLDSIDYPDIAARMKCPFLLIYGSEDPLFSEESVLQAAERIGSSFSDRDSAAGCSPMLKLMRIQSLHRFTPEHMEALLKFAEEQTR